MHIHGLHHYTLRCEPSQLEVLKEFYEKVLNLHPGARPGLRFDGFWLYAGGQPTVHLYASGQVESGRTALDHIAFKATGLEETRERLARLGVAFTEAPVPDWPMHQVFIHDPTGLRIELAFDVSP